MQRYLNCETMTKRWAMCPVNVMYGELTFLSKSYLALWENTSCPLMADKSLGDCRLGKITCYFGVEKKAMCIQKIILKVTGH